MLHPREGIKRITLKDYALSCKAPQPLSDTAPNDLLFKSHREDKQNKNQNTKQNHSLLTARKHRALMTKMCSINLPGVVRVHHTVLLQI